MDAMVILRLTHIVLGVFWAGTIFFITMFLLPAVRRAGPAGGSVMYHVARSRFIVALPSAAGLTILSGAAMFWTTSGQLNPAWLGSTPGTVLSFGAACAIVTFAIGMSIQRPATIRIADLADEIQASGGTPSAEQAARLAMLQRRVRMSLNVMSALLMAAVICMAVFRYL
jgi:hypothetical protein